jgi:hypothetical protein
MFANPARRRSLSTSALVGGLPSTAFASSPLVWVREDPASNRNAIAPGVGPIRPRLGRHHTHAGSHVYTRPPFVQTGSRARQSSSSISPVQSTRPRSLSFRAHSFPTEFVAPTPPSWRSYGPPRSFHDATMSNRGRPSTETPMSSRYPSELDSIAERRNNRLPPIKLLIDELDSAIENDPSRFGPSTVQSCPSLVSPFERLELQSPQEARRSGYSESGLSYFEQQRTPVPERYSPPALSPTYQFGTSFGSSAV